MPHQRWIWGNPLHTGDASGGSTLDLKPWAYVTNSPRKGSHWSKQTDLCSQKNLPTWKSRSVSMQVTDPPWHWNQAQTSPEVQNILAQQNGLMSTETFLKKDLAQSTKYLGLIHNISIYSWKIIEPNKQYVHHLYHRFVRFRKWVIDFWFVQWRPPNSNNLSMRKRERCWNSVTLNSPFTIPKPCLETVFCSHGAC